MKDPITKPLPQRVGDSIIIDDLRALKQSELLTAYTTGTNEWSLQTRYAPPLKETYPEFYNDLVKIPFSTLFDALEGAKDITEAAVGAAYLGWEDRKKFSYGSRDASGHFDHAGFVAMATYEHYLVEAFQKDLSAIGTYAGAIGSVGLTGLSGPAAPLLAGALREYWTPKVVEKMKDQWDQPLARAMGPLAAAFSYAAEHTIRDSKDGWTWAMTDPQGVEDFSRGTFDPLLYTSFIAGPMSKLNLAVELKRFAPVLGDLKVAGKLPVGERALETFRAMMKTEGADFVNPRFLALVEDAARTGMSNETFGKILIENGYSMPHSSLQWVSGKIPEAAKQYFRRANTLYSPAIGDLGRMADLEIAMAKHNFHKALQEIGAISKEELQPLQWALHNVPRSFEEPGKTFLANYAKMQGEKNAVYIHPDSLERFSKLIDHVGLGWRAAIPAEMKAAGVEIIGDSGFMRAYGPSKAAVIDAELAKTAEKGLPSTRLSQKMYRNSRMGSHFIIDEKALAGRFGTTELRVPSWEPTTLSRLEIENALQRSGNPITVDEKFSPYLEASHLEGLSKYFTQSGVSPIFNERLDHALGKIARGIRSGIYKDVDASELSLLLKHPPLREVIKEEQNVMDFIALGRAYGKRNNQVKYPMEEVSRFLDYLRKTGQMEAAGASKESFVKISKEYGTKLLKESQGFFREGEDLSRWIAAVSTRVSRIDAVNKLAEEAMLYKRNLAEVARNARAHIYNLPASPNERAMFEEILAHARFLTKQVNRLVRNAKMGKTNSGLTRRLRDSEVGPLLRSYQAGMNLWKTGVLAGNPAWHINNLKDSVIWKRLLATGSIDGEAIAKSLVLEPMPPMFSIKGKQIFTEEMPGASNLDLSADGGRIGGAVGRAARWASNKADIVQNNARNSTFRSVYKATVDSFLGRGLSEDVADHYAQRIARTVTDQFQYQYATVPPAVKDASIIFPWANFATQEAALMANLTMKYPGEVYDVFRAREAMRSGSSDGRGSIVPIPAKDPVVGRFTQTIDPAGGAALVRHLDDTLNLALDGDRTVALPAANQVAKVAQAVMGSVGPVPRMLMQKTGVEFDRGYGSTIPQEELARSGLKSLADLTAPTPTDFMYDVLGGGNSQESRESWRERRAAMVQFSTRLDEQAGRGPEITREEARKAVDFFDLQANVASLVGSRTSIDSEGWRETMKRLDEVKYIQTHMDDKEINSPGFKKVLEQDRYRDMYEFIPKPQVTRERAKERQIINTEQMNSQPQKDFEKQKEAENPGIFSPSKLGAGFRSLWDALPSMKDPFATDASAAEFPTIGVEPLTKKELVQRADVILKGANITAAAISDMKELPSAEAKAQYVINHGWAVRGTDPKTFRDMVIRSGSDVAAGMYQDVRYALTDGAEGVLDLSDPGSKGVRNRAADALNNYALTHGAAAAKQIGTVEGARAVARVPGVMPLNLDENSIDLAVVRVAEARRDAGFDFKLGKNAERQLQQKYPDFGKFVGMLQLAERPGVAQEGNLQAAIDFGAAAIKDGRLPSDIYQQINENPLYRDTYQRVENAAMVGQVNAVWDHITFKRDGKVTGINPVALSEMATSSKYSDWLPALQQIAKGNAGEQRAQWLNSAVGDLDPSVAPYVMGSLSTSPERLAQHRTENFEAMTGQVHPDLSQLLGDHRDNPLPFLSFITRQEPPIPGVSPTGPVPSPVSGITPTSERAPMPAPATPFNFSYTGPGSPGQGISSPASFLSSSWNDYSIIHASWKSSPSLQSSMPPPSFAGQIANKWNEIGNADGKGVSLAQARVGVGGLQMAYSLASIGMMAAGEDMPQDVSSAFSGLSTGMSVAAMGGFTPPALVLGAAAGIATGLFGGKKSSQNNAYNEANLKINQQRLDLEREKYAESLRQQGIRDIRTREGDLARALGGLNPAQRSAVGQQLATFQRRPTYQSRIGLVDAAERAVGSVLKPRW